MNGPSSSADPGSRVAVAPVSLGLTLLLGALATLPPLSIDMNLTALAGMAASSGAMGSIAVCGRMRWTCDRSLWNTKRIRQIRPARPSDSMTRPRRTPTLATVQSLAAFDRMQTSSAFVDPS